MKTYAMGSIAVLLCAFQANIVQADIGKELLECRKITVISSRVSCYDEIADKLNKMAKEGKDINERIIFKPQTSSSSRERTAAQENLETFGLREPEGETVSLEVKKIKFGPRKQFMITTTNGQVWLQTGNKKVNLPTRVPFGIMIERGAMGSYFLYAKGQKTFYKAKRIK